MSLFIIPVIAETYAQINECFPNVENKIDVDGGYIIYGWQIWKNNLMCEAEFHAVWKSNDSKLIDITPKDPPVKNILFIQDDNVHYNGAQIDNIRINNTSNFLVVDLIHINKALFIITNKGERAYNYEIVLTNEEAKIFRNLERFKIELEDLLIMEDKLISSVSVIVVIVIQSAIERNWIC